MVSTASRSLRRKLRPLPWLVLEEVALTAVEDGGRWVAHTSARQVADQVGVDPGTAAGALRSCGIVAYSGWSARRAELAASGSRSTCLGSIAGLTLVKPSEAERHLALPSLDETDIAKPHAAAARAEKPCADMASGAAPATALAHMATEPGAQECGLPPAPAVAPIPADRPRTAALLAVPALQILGQGTLDLDGSIA